MVGPLCTALSAVLGKPAHPFLPGTSLSYATGWIEGCQCQTGLSRGLGGTGVLSNIDLSRSPSHSLSLVQFHVPLSTRFVLSVLPLSGRDRAGRKGSDVRRGKRVAEVILPGDPSRSSGEEDIHQGTALPQPSSTIALPTSPSLLPPLTDIQKNVLRDWEIHLPDPIQREIHIGLF